MIHRIRAILRLHLHVNNVNVRTGNDVRRLQVVLTYLLPNRRLFRAKRASRQISSCLTSVTVLARMRLPFNSMAYVIERDVHSVAAKRDHRNGGHSQAANERLGYFFMGLDRVKVRKAQRKILQQSLIRAIKRSDRDVHMINRINGRRRRFFILLRNGVFNHAWNRVKSRSAFCEKIFHHVSGTSSAVRHANVTGHVLGRRVIIVHRPRAT